MQVRLPDLALVRFHEGAQDRVNAGQVAAALGLEPGQHVGIDRPGGTTTRAWRQKSSSSSISGASARVGM